MKNQGESEGQAMALSQTAGSKQRTPCKEMTATPLRGERRGQEGGMKYGTRNRIGALLLAALLSVGSFAAQAAPSETAPKSRAAHAQAMFAERCKSAGEFIHRTVENVEGVYLLKLRPDKINYGDQFRMDDPYGSGIGGQGFIKNFLRGRNPKGSLVDSGEFVRGYRYVEAIDAADGKRYRYTGSMKVVSKANVNAPDVKRNLQMNPNYDINNYAYRLDKVAAPAAPPRYGVTYDDISTREEREYWIAGSSLKVIDLQTIEVIAERVGYMMDPGQGAKGGGRAPWLLAAEMACPKFPQAGGSAFQMHENRNFVEKVLHIKQGD